MEDFATIMCEFGASHIRPQQIVCRRDTNQYLEQGQHVVIENSIHGLYMGPYTGIMYYNQSKGCVSVTRDKGCITHVVEYSNDTRRQRHDTLRVARMFDELDFDAKRSLSSFTTDVALCLLCRIGLHDDLAIMECNLRRIPIN